MTFPDATSATPRRSSASLSAQGCLCRNCGSTLEDLVVDLGLSPLCESLVHRDALNLPESFYPLRAFVCNHCWLVQLHDHVSGIEIFDESYAYLSSMSTTWLEHCRRYTHEITDRLSLTSESLVVEVASNDGYLLKNFVDAGIPCVGIEPATRVAELAKAQGIEVLGDYFGVQSAEQFVAQRGKADLMIGNNVLAHVPDLHDFIGGYKIVLSENGTITYEFPHLLHLIEQNQFDTIYQEHYCYFSLLALKRVFQKHNLRIYDVDQLPTHGGSLRIYVCHQNNSTLVDNQRVAELISLEESRGLAELATYQEFSRRVQETKWKLLEFLINAKRNGQRVAGYGAPGKGNTLLNYCGIREDLIEFTVDRNPLKHDTFLVGSRIPVYPPGVIDEQQPDYVLILPWNLKEEIMQQMAHIRDWGGRFVVPIPELQIL